MTSVYKTHRSYKLSDATLANLETTKKATGVTATAVVETAVAEYSLQWRLLEKFFGDVAGVKLYLEMRAVIERMMLGKRCATDWDEPIEEWLRKTFELVMLDQKDPGLAAKEFDSMLEKLEGRIATLRDEIAEAY